MYIDPDNANPELVAELAKTYEDAAARLKKIVLHPPGGTASSQKFNQARASSQLAQVTQEITALKRDVSNWTGKAITNATHKGIVTANRQAISAGIRGTPPLPGEDPIGATWRQQAAKMSMPKLKQAIENKQKFRSETPGATEKLASQILHEELALRQGKTLPEPLSGSFSLVDKRAIEIITRDTVGDLYKAAEGMKRGAELALRHMAATGVTNAEVNRIVAGGIIEGQPRQVITELRDALSKVHGDQVTVTTKNGGSMTFDVDYYARIVANSKMRAATVSSRHGRLIDLGLDLVKIIGMQSVNPCSLLLGKIFSLSGRDPRHPAFSSVNRGQLPYKLFHPNCTKSTAPFVEGLSKAQTRGESAAEAA